MSEGIILYGIVDTSIENDDPALCLLSEPGHEDRKVIFRSMSGAELYAKRINKQTEKPCYGGPGRFLVMQLEVRPTGEPYHV
jgi:hypothetical protein